MPISLQSRGKQCRAAHAVLCLCCDSYPNVQFRKIGVNLGKPGYMEAIGS